MPASELLEILNKKFAQAAAGNFRERVFSSPGGRYDFVTAAKMQQLIPQVQQLLAVETASDNPSTVLKILEYLEAQSMVAYNKAVSNDNLKSFPFFNNFLTSATTDEENYEALLAKTVLQAAASNPMTILSEAVKGILLTSATARGYSENEASQRIEATMLEVQAEIRENPNNTM
jgi:hypothetical protein